MKKRYLFLAVCCIALFFFIPIIFVMLPVGKEMDKEMEQSQSPQQDEAASESPEADSTPSTEAGTEQVSVPVFRSQTETVEEVNLEDYVAGVVASEMPAEFEMEALKAQALTARTYVAKQLSAAADINLPGGALVTDTPIHQVYQNEQELKEKWGEDYEWKMERIRQAVEETAGQVLTYQDEPITAAFFSTSNGYTENAEDYWQNPVPYLQSVKSPWDTESPRYENSLRVPVSEVESKLGITIGANESGEIISRTEGGRVAAMKLGGKRFHGREIRETLNLDSSDFQIIREGNDLVFQTKGWGHGVGMSQYGAEGMAQEGKSYREIVTHYYKGVDISTFSSI